jgi:acetyl esterase/lipase
MAGQALPAALVLISPWTDLTFSGKSVQTRKSVDPIFGGDGNRIGYAPSYLGVQDPSNPLISPLFAELQRLPPTLIHVGSDEILLDDSTHLVIWEDMWHVFQVFAPYAPEAQLSIDKLGEFIQQSIP